MRYPSVFPFLDYGLYGSKRVKIPTPEFFVVYTGSQKWKTTTLRLSDSFLHKPPENSVELVVKIIKMHYNNDDEQSQKVLERSEKLRGYSLLLECIKDYRSQGKDAKEAVNMAIQRCISEGILKDFLEKNSPEVGSMLFKEITSEEFAEIRVNGYFFDFVRRLSGCLYVLLQGKCVIDGR